MFYCLHSTFENKICWFLIKPYIYLKKQEKHQKPYTKIISECWAKDVYTKSEVHGDSEMKRKAAV